MAKRMLNAWFVCLFVSDGGLAFFLSVLRSFLISASLSPTKSSTAQASKVAPKRVMQLDLTFGVSINRVRGGCSGLVR